MPFLQHALVERHKCKPESNSTCLWRTQVALVLHLLADPFTTSRQSRLELVSLVVITFTYNSGLLYMGEVQSPGSGFWI